MDVGSQGRCSRRSRALGEEIREQSAPRVSAPPRRLPALFPQFALLPQSGPRLILCTCQWAHTSSPGTILPSSTFLTINLPATAGKVAGCEWGGEGRFAHSEAPELAAGAQMACFLRFLTNLGGMLSWPPAARPDPALLTPGLLAPLPKSAARGMLAPTFAAPVPRPAPLPPPKDVPLQ
uniref:Uncharacterized protein n=1 Tax=Cebus imitator TaxID=2715852 RepID=A0A2K5QZ92_CEBIM